MYVLTANRLVGYNLRSKYVAEFYFIFEDMFLYIYAVENSSKYIMA
jgi:hypothetical protein